jgi:CRP-like cAMP-binding protein
VKHGAIEAVTRHIASRLREAEQVRSEIEIFPVPQRLARALVRLAASGAGSEFSLSQEQLARLIGASRNAVVKALAELRTQGIIATSRRHLIVRDLASLRRFAAGDTVDPNTLTL